MRKVLAFLAALAAQPALAHPHAWVVAKAELVYAPDGKIAAVRHAWTFDEMTSASWLEGKGPGSGELAPNESAELAGNIKEYAAPFGSFTSLKANGTKPPFADWRDARMTFDKGLVTLHFELPLKVPAPANRHVVLTVSDPTFFIDFQTAPGDDAVKLAGAPAGCVLTITRPKQQPQTNQPLSESLFKSLADASSFASQFASRSTVACP